MIFGYTFEKQVALKTIASLEINGVTYNTEN